METTALSSQALEIFFSSGSVRKILDMISTSTSEDLMSRRAIWANLSETSATMKDLVSPDKLEKIHLSIRLEFLNEFKSVLEGDLKDVTASASGCVAQFLDKSREIEKKVLEDARQRELEEEIAAEQIRQRAAAAAEQARLAEAQKLEAVRAEARRKQNLKDIWMGLLYLVLGVIGLYLAYEAILWVFDFLGWVYDEVGSIWTDTLVPFFLEYLWWFVAAFALLMLVTGLWAYLLGLAVALFVIAWLIQWIIDFL
jgi:hypothetical protein